MSQGYCEFVKKIAIWVPGDFDRRTRITAAEHDKSQSAMVRGLMTPGQDESGVGRRKRLQKEVLSTVDLFRAGGRPTRGTQCDSLMRIFCWTRSERFLRKFRAALLAPV